MSKLRPGGQGRLQVWKQPRRVFSWQEQLRADIQEGAAAVAGRGLQGQGTKAAGGWLLPLTSPSPPGRAAAVAPNTPTPPTTCRRHVTPCPGSEHGPSMVPKQPPGPPRPSGCPRCQLHGLGGYRDNRLARLGVFHDVPPLSLSDLVYYET